MTEAEMREVVLQGYAARDAGRAHDLVSVFHDQGTFRIAASKKTLAIADIAEGHASIRSAMESFIGSFRFTDREVLGWFFGHDQAAVHSRLQVTFIPENTIFMTEIMDLFKFEDGKIHELIEFADTALIAKIISPQI